MSRDRISELEALLGRAEAAHADYERTELNGVYDQAWARWYAEYAVDNGIAALLGREVGAAELEAFLSRSWNDDGRSSTQPWAAVTARRLAAVFHEAG